MSDREPDAWLTPTSLDKPAPAYGVVGYEVRAAKPTDQQDPVVLVQILTHEMAVVCFLLSPYEARLLAMDLGAAADLADDE